MFRKPLAAAIPLVLVSRLIYWRAPLLPDEAGFLMVARQWRAGLGSLYGAYWVDRPPLLIGTFALADTLGGSTGLRALGIGATCATVMVVPLIARRIEGDRAAAIAAIVTALLAISPLSGASEVNGELLAAPFVAGGILSWLTAIDRVDARFAACAGACGTAAVLMKQNMLDVAVFAVATIVLTSRARHLKLLGGAGLGAVTTAAVVVGAGWQRGTSPIELGAALYAFRFQAGELLARHPPGTIAERAHLLLRASAGGTGLALAAVLVVLMLRRRRIEPLTAALLTVAAWDVFSIVMGGNYWLHYLVQLLVPVSILCGVVGSRSRRRHILPGMSALALIGLSALGVVAIRPATARGGEAVGTAIAAAAVPGDRLTALYGSPTVNWASGLNSPYPYLWSLPLKVRDPALRQLDSTLRGPNGPEWVVVTHRLRTWGEKTRTTDSVLDRHYRPVARLCGMRIYLRIGVRRSVPVAHCTASDPLVPPSERVP